MGKGKKLPVVCPDGCVTVIAREKVKAVVAVFDTDSLKPGLHGHFLCDKYIFDRVDDTAIICQQSKFSDLEQLRYAQRFADTVPSGSLGGWGPQLLNMLMQYLPHLM